MIIYTGSEARGYNPVTDSWRLISQVNQPQMSAPVSIWTGFEVIVLGGDSNGQPVGGKYNPSADSWSALSIVGLPSVYPEGQPTVWTGSAMIVWMGLTSYAYHPDTDSWTPVGGVEPPSTRINPIVIWAGNEMIVWGGQVAPSTRLNPVQEGNRYDPTSDLWSSIDPAGSVWAMEGDAAVWTGKEMILWTVEGGAAYDPAADTWRSISATNAPTTSGPAVWTGTDMIVWSGEEGGRYTP
jgi:N-acetylneuraminic acid mutarotase